MSEVEYRLHERTGDACRNQNDRHPTIEPGWGIALLTRLSRLTDVSSQLGRRLVLVPGREVERRDDLTG